MHDVRGTCHATLGIGEPSSATKSVQFTGVDEVSSLNFNDTKDDTVDSGIGCNQIIGVEKNKSNNGEFSVTEYSNDDDKVIAGVEEMLIDAVSASHKRFTKRDQPKADRVRCFQRVACFLSDATIAHSCTTNGIKNNPITKHDVEIAKEMLGPIVHAAKGNTTKK